MGHPNFRFAKQKHFNNGPWHLSGSCPNKNECDIQRMHKLNCLLWKLIKLIVTVISRSLAGIVQEKTEQCYRLLVALSTKWQTLFQAVAVDFFNFKVFQILVIRLKVHSYPGISNTYYTCDKYDGSRQAQTVSWHISRGSCPNIYLSYQFNKKWMWHWTAKINTIYVTRISTPFWNWMRKADQCYRLLVALSTESHGFEWIIVEWKIEAHDILRGSICLLNIFYAYIVCWKFAGCLCHISLSTTSNVLESDHIKLESCRCSVNYHSSSDQGILLVS
jgi:hypothetical protein